jgi:hypothetical protein
MKSQGARSIVVEPYFDLKTRASPIRSEEVLVLSPSGWIEGSNRLYPAVWYISLLSASLKQLTGK